MTTQIMIQYKGVNYFLTEEPPKQQSKGKVYQYSLSLNEPLKPLQVSSLPEARKKVEKIIDEKLKQKL